MKSLMAAVFSLVLGSIRELRRLPPSFHLIKLNLMRRDRPASRSRWCFMPIGAPPAAHKRPCSRNWPQTPALKSLTLYVANFDTEKGAKKILGVTQQSTIVVFKGGKEIARSTGDTQRDRPRAALLKQAVS